MDESIQMTIIQLIIVKKFELDIFLTLNNFKKCAQPSRLFKCIRHAVVCNSSKAICYNSSVSADSTKILTAE
jgi:hypothetical protein